MSSSYHRQTAIPQKRRLVDHKSGNYMSKPRLLLIHCSKGIQPRAEQRQRGRGFRPLVIHGRARARSAPRESSWEAALELINLGFLISRCNYLAFLRASTTVLEVCSRTYRES
jgi:hypothetical protein